MSWDGDAKRATCVDCTGEPDLVAAGEAGRSASREYDRRSKRERSRKETAIARDREWRTQLTTERPVVGRLVTAMTPKPQMTPESPRTANWSKGAVGERRVAEVLNACSGVRMLHDRRIPGSKANIDHLVIGPGGIYVIDAKHYDGAVVTRDSRSWLRADYHLYVRGRDQHKLVEKVEWQLDQVMNAVRGRGVVAPLAGILCFVDALWPRVFRRPLRFGTVTALWPDALPAAVCAAGPLSANDIDHAATVLAKALPPA